MASDGAVINALYSLQTATGTEIITNDGKISSVGIKDAAENYAKMEKDKIEHNVEKIENYEIKNLILIALAIVIILLIAIIATIWMYSSANDMSSVNDVSFTTDDFSGTKIGNYTGPYKSWEQKDPAAAKMQYTHSVAPVYRGAYPRVPDSWIQSSLY